MRRRAVAAVALGVAAFTVTGCAASSSTGAPSSAAAAPTTTRSAAGTGSSAPAESPVEVTGGAWSHVHNLAYDGPALLLGTHEGLYRQEPGQPPRLLSDTPFDVMGLTNDGARWLASGHPGTGEDLPGDLGLRASDDGTTWTTLSLLGEVDFHRLTAVGSTIVGVAAHDGALLRSTDAGSTFTRLDNPGVFDVALDPGDPASALATTQTGPVSSTDAGTTWRPASGAPLLAFLAWTSAGVYGVAPDGTVHRSTDRGDTWGQRGSTGGQPAAVAADGDRVAVMVGGTVLESTDGGSAFTSRLTGIGGH
jgi:hypothetical protein